MIRRAPGQAQKAIELGDQLSPHVLWFECGHVAGPVPNVDELAVLLHERGDALGGQHRITRGQVQMQANAQVGRLGERLLQAGGGVRVVDHHRGGCDNAGLIRFQNAPVDARRASKVIGIHDQLLHRSTILQARMQMVRRIPES